MPAASPVTVDALVDGDRYRITHIACCAEPATLCGLSKADGRQVDRESDCVVCDDIARTFTCPGGTCPEDDQP